MLGLGTFYFSLVGFDRIIFRYLQDYFSDAFKGSPSKHSTRRPNQQGHLPTRRIAPLIPKLYLEAPLTSYVGVREGFVGILFGLLGEADLLSQKEVLNPKPPNPTPDH